MSGKPKNFSGIIFGLTTIKVKQLKLQTPSFVSLKRATIKKKNFELRTPKFFIFCKLY